MCNVINPAATGGSRSYGELVEIAPGALLIVGRMRNLEAGISSVANAVMYKSGTQLVVIDVGATAGFRAYLDEAARRLQPYDRVTLISTHGHCDHTGNNGWIDTLGVPAEAYMSVRDLAMMRDQINTFVPMFDEARPFVPGMPAGRVLAESAIGQFGTLDVETRSLTLLESLPSEEIRIGSTLWNGWRLFGGEVVALKTQGHTVGHVAVLLPAIGHLHLADETTSYYQAFSGGSPETNLLTLERTAQALREGAIRSLTDGHSFEFYPREQATAYLERLVGSALAFDAAITRILREHPGGIRVPDLMAKLRAAPEMEGAPMSAEANPILPVMQLLNKMKELGVPVPAEGEGLLRFPR
ncbi:MBL fold metallo-hydrolase [Cupriavidus sp. WS]|uniref:MBL fold metallo-hydrolase n=1 Tax=Cupriavidus sp. WS TaxID=1312922 RepID=UPI00036E6C5C|nr:MBL fold metallo-hydrolase [Cupriavidus sp. WS]